MKLAAAPLLAALLVTGCPNEAKPPGAFNSPSAPEMGHKYVILATACWFGGFWSDAEGDKASARAGEDRQRCADVVNMTYDNSREHIEQFRALEQGALDAFVSRAADLAGDDTIDAPRKDQVVKLAKAVSAAHKELLHLRRAAHRVVSDASEREGRLTDDEAKAVGPLREQGALEALYSLDAGDLTKEARAIALLSIVNRVSIARGLPRLLKIVALEGSMRLLFGVTPPDVGDVTKPPEPLALLKFLSEAASAAGHPVPETATTPREKYTLAYTGMLAGVADKLKSEAAGLSKMTELARIVEVTEKRLDDEYQFERARLTTPTPAPP